MNYYKTDREYVEFLRTIASRGRLNDEDIPILFEAADAYNELAGRMEGLEK